MTGSARLRTMLRIAGRTMRPVCGLRPSRRPLRGLLRMKGTRHSLHPRSRGGDTRCKPRARCVARTPMHTLRSSSANGSRERAPDDRLRRTIQYARDVSDRTGRPRRTGCPAFAGHDAVVALAMTVEGPQRHPACMGCDAALARRNIIRRAGDLQPGSRPCERPPSGSN
jgi:hypothetical protein